MERWNVRFALESGHVQCNEGCPLWAKSGQLATDSITSSVRASIDGETNDSQRCRNRAEALHGVLLAPFSFSARRIVRGCNYAEPFWNPSSGSTVSKRRDGNRK